MALPDSVSTVTVTGRFLRTDGTPAVGTVLFRPTASVLRVPADDVVLIPRGRGAVLDANGAFSVVLPNLSDPDVQPTGSTYAVEARLEGRPPLAFAFAVPVGATTLDFADLVPTTQSPGVWTPVVGGGGGGAVVLADLADVATAGSSAGDVLSYNGTEWVPAAAPAPSLALDALTDVAAASPASGDVLSYNGTEWVPQAPASGGGSGGGAPDAYTLFPRLNAVKKGQRGATSWWASDVMSALGDMATNNRTLSGTVPDVSVFVSESVSAGATDRYGFEWPVFLRAGSWRMSAVASFMTGNATTHVLQGIVGAEVGSLVAGPSANAQYPRLYDLGAFTVAVDGTYAVRLEAGVPGQGTVSLQSLSLFRTGA